MFLQGDSEYVIIIFLLLNHFQKRSENAANKTVESSRFLHVHVTYHESFFKLITMGECDCQTTKEDSVSFAMDFGCRCFSSTPFPKKYLFAGRLL